MSRPKHIKETRFEYLKRTIAEHGDSDECLLWPFAKNRWGYGILVWSPQPRMVQQVKAHQLAYFLTHGECALPLGRHTCDIPACFNPRHIIPGTDAENVADKVARGRCARVTGEANGAAKLTEEIVAQIRKRALTERHIDIAKALGLERHTVTRAIRGDSWPHLPGRQPSSDHIDWMRQAISEHGENPACLIWPFPSKRSIPHLRVDGTKRSIHHVAFMLKHGHFPKPSARWSCGDHYCVNPNHIYESKRFAVRVPSLGEANASAKLRWVDVTQIRSVRTSGLTQQQLAEKYGVSQKTISNVLRETHWKQPMQNASETNQNP